MLAGQTTHALAFSTHDQDGRAGQVLVINADLGLTRCAHYPQTALLEFFQSARQVGHGNQRNHFRGTAGDFSYNRCQGC
ncbi:hypothetical protein D3C84_1266030 [compost metagenome]